jgi:hypothetical protein
VLLDASGNAKVADFGTVREGAAKGAGGAKPTATHTHTGAVVGTSGYMPGTSFPCPLPLSFFSSPCIYNPLQWSTLREEK